MALRGDRHELYTDQSFFMNETATRGIIVVYLTGGSGSAMDNASAVVGVPTGTASGTDPAGLLLNDVVNLDLTRQHLNQHQDEVQQGSKVTLLKTGWVVTDDITGTPTVGAAAYYDNAGQLTPVNPLASIAVPSADWNLNVDRHKVGQFMSIADADGFVKVAINIQ